MNETELDRLAGTRMQLEMQVNTLESANLNAETMAAMKKASEALKVIHGNMCVHHFPSAHTINLPSLHCLCFMPFLIRLPDLVPHLHRKQDYG